MSGAKPQQGPGAELLVSGEGEIFEKYSDIWCTLSNSGSVVRDNMQLHFSLVMFYFL